MCEREHTYVKGESRRAGTDGFSTFIFLLIAMLALTSCSQLFKGSALADLNASLQLPATESTWVLTVPSSLALSFSSKKPKTEQTKSEDLEKGERQQRHSEQDCGMRRKKTPRTSHCFHKTLFCHLHSMLCCVWWAKHATNGCKRYRFGIKDPVAASLLLCFSERPSYQVW